MNQPPPIRPPRGPRGFTLIEILVCVTIIIVLAVVVTIGSSKMKQRSQKIASIARVRDIGTSVVAYATEKGEMPVWHDYDKEMYWWQLIQEADGVNDPNRFRSPGHKEFDPEKPAITLSYGYNYLVMGRHKGKQSTYVGDNVLRLSDFSEPSRVLVLADGAAVNSYGFIDPDFNKPDPLRYDGMVAAFILDGSCLLLESPKEFKSAESKWFLSVKKLNQR